MEVQMKWTGLLRVATLRLKDNSTKSMLSTCWYFDGLVASGEDIREVVHRIRNKYKKLQAEEARTPVPRDRWIKESISGRRKPS
jgi:hypothetical protein